VTASLIKSNPLIPDNSTSVRTKELPLQFSRNLERTSTSPSPLAWTETPTLVPRWPELLHQEVPLVELLGVVLPEEEVPVHQEVEELPEVVHSSPEEVFLNQHSRDLNPSLKNHR